MLYELRCEKIFSLHAYVTKKGADYPPYLRPGGVIDLSRVIRKPVFFKKQRHRSAAQ